MSAYNWIVTMGLCPTCRQPQKLVAQTHIASDYDGDDTGRFHDRTYTLGEAMHWWPPSDSRYGEWRANRCESTRMSSEIDEEACHATCSVCGTVLFALLRFRGPRPIELLAAGLESDWPTGCLK